MGASWKVEFEGERVLKAAVDGSVDALRKAGAYVRTAASRLIRRNPRPSLPGRPPHTRKGLLRRSIRFGVEKRRVSVVIGPSARIAGPSGAAHEFGGRYRKERYPARPFMGPALSATARKLPALWEDAVGK